jgi:hypothetical protein
MRMMFAIAAIAGLTLAAPAMADDWDFILINQTGKAIKEVELAPNGGTSWQKNKVEEDMAKKGPIKTGARSTIHFDKAGSQCKYDVKATFEDDSTAVWSGINVCDAAFVTIKYANNAPSFTIG